MQVGRLVVRLLRPERLRRELALEALLAAVLVIVETGASWAKLGHHLVGNVIALHLLTMDSLLQVTLFDVSMPVGMGRINGCFIDVETAHSFVHLALRSLRQICDVSLGLLGLFPVA